MEVFGIICVVYFYYSVLRSSKKTRLHRESQLRVSRIAGQMVSLAVMSLIWGIGYHMFAETGFFRNPSAVAEVVRRYYSIDIPERTLGEMLSIVEDKEYFIIDAREISDFQAGAIPRAISVPVNSTLPERQQALRKISASSALVVYCQSSGCRYADEMAAFLNLNGYSNLSIYRGGYLEWIARRGPTSEESTNNIAGASKTEEIK